MVSYSVEKYPNEPILVGTMPADFDYTTEGEAIIAEILDVLNSLDEPVDYIADLSEAKFSLTDLMSATSRTGRDSDAFLHHHNIRNIYFIASGLMWELVADGFSTETYGNLTITIFGSLGEVLAHIRGE